jgi:hypothetical protein
MLDGRFSRVTSYADTRQATGESTGDNMPEWIGVKEKLPDVGMAKSQDDGWLVYKPSASRKIETCFVHPDWWWQDDGSSQEITHWMPLPESPVASNKVINLTKQ